MDNPELVAIQIGSRIRECRRAKNITLQVLSDETTLSTGFLSKLERGEASASIANLISISKYLGLSLQDLFQTSAEAAPPPPDYVLSKAKARNDEAPLSAAGYTFHRSCGDLPGQQLAAFELEFPANQEKQPTLVSHEGEEVLYMLDGKLEFHIGDDVLILERGDCLHFNCEKPHMGRNIGAKTARLMMVVSSASPIKRRFGKG